MQEYICVKCEHKESCSYSTELNEVITILCDNGIDEMIKLTCNEFKEREVEEDEL